MFQKYWPRLKWWWVGHDWGSWIVWELAEGLVRFFPCGLGYRPVLRGSVIVFRRGQLHRRASELEVKVRSVRLVHHLRLERGSDLEKRHGDHIVVYLSTQLFYSANQSSSLCHPFNCLRWDNYPVSSFTRFVRAPLLANPWVTITFSKPHSKFFKSKSSKTRYFLRPGRTKRSSTRSRTDYF